MRKIFGCILLCCFGLWGVHCLAPVDVAGLPCTEQEDCGSMPCNNKVCGGSVSELPKADAGEQQIERPVEQVAEAPLEQLPEPNPEKIPEQTTEPTVEQVVEQPIESPPTETPNTICIPTKSKGWTAAHQNDIKGLLFIPGRDMFVTSSTVGAVKFWDSQSQNLKKGITPSGIPLGLAVDPQGKTLAIQVNDGGKPFIHLWDLQSYKLIRTLKGLKSFATSMAFHPKKPVLAVATQAPNITIWDTNTGTIVETLVDDKEKLTKWIYGLRFHPTKELLFVADVSTSIRIWRTDTYSIDQRWGTTRLVRNIDFSLDGKALLFSDDTHHTLHRWFILGGYDKTFEIKGHTSTITSMVLHPSGKYIFTASSDKTIRVWELPSGKPVQTLTTHTAGISKLAISADGKTLMAAETFKNIAFWTCP